VRGKAVVDYKSGWRMWLVDGRLVRDEKEREKQDREAAEGLRAVRKLEKTEDGKAFKLSASAVKAMRSYDKKVEAVAKERWHGKVAEVTAVSWSSHQDQKTGEHAGETLFSFDV